MSKKPRYIELFTENLPEPYRTAAISQIDEDYIERLKETPKNIASALVFFVPFWKETKEGSEFWAVVHNHFLIPSEFSELPPYPKHLILTEPTPEPKQVQKNIVEVLIDMKKELQEIRAEIKTIKNLLQWPKFSKQF